MPALRPARVGVFIFGVFVFLLAACPLCRAQAALLMEEPYGFFGMLNPTGHNSIYLARLCAATPVRLRHCAPGEPGAVIARYQGIDGYDWIAMPLIPYLYSVDSISEIPASADRDTVQRLRLSYRETGLKDLGDKLTDGDLLHGGWTQLVGMAYQRRIYAFWFKTTAAQDEALMVLMNDGPNRTKFNLLFSNCSDFARSILNDYYPGVFKRSMFPDAGMTTPKQIAYKLVRYGRRHPEAGVRVFVIPQIPGYRRRSHSNKGIAESFVTTAYAIPLAIVNPYLAGGIFADYMIRGRYRIISKDPQVLTPETMGQWLAPNPSPTDTAGATVQATPASGMASSDF